MKYNINLFASRSTKLKILFLLLHRISSKTFEQDFPRYCRIIFLSLKIPRATTQIYTTKIQTLHRSLCTPRFTTFTIFLHYNFPPLFQTRPEEEFNPRLNIKHTKLLSSSRGKLKRVAPSKKQDFSRRYTSLRFHTAAVSIVAESRNDPIAIFHRANATLQALATLFFSPLLPLCYHLVAYVLEFLSVNRLTRENQPSFTMEISPGASARYNLCK